MNMWGRSASKLRSSARLFSQQTAPPAGSPASAAKVQTEPTAEGLSSAVVTPPSGPVGPNVNNDKTGPYKVPEYFCYHTMSYYEAEIEMSKHRLPQPSALK